MDRFRDIEGVLTAVVFGGACVCDRSVTDRPVCNRPKNRNMERHLADCFHHSFRIHDDQGECIYRYQSEYLTKIDNISAPEGSNKQQICSVGKLEEGSKDLAHRYDSRSVTLSQIHKDNAGKAENEETVNGLPDETTIEKLVATDELLSARGAWSWVIRLHDATGVHLRNAANYHQFYMNADQYGKCLNAKLPALIRSLEEDKFNPNVDDGKRLLQKGKDLLFALRLYQTKIVELLELSHSIVPVHKRTNLNKEPLPVRAMVAFKGTNVEFREGEDLLLLDNSNPEMWKVKTSDGNSGLVPAPVVLIPPPDTEAIQAVFRSLVQLLGHWSLAVKILCAKCIFPYVAGSIKDWKINQERILKALPNNSKTEISTVLTDSSDTVSVFRCSHPLFDEFDENVKSVSNTLTERSTTRVAANDAEVSTLNEHGMIIRDLLLLWRDVVGGFERYNLLTQLSRWPEFMLMPEGWENYSWSSMETIITKWREEFFRNMNMIDQTDSNDGADGSSQDIVEETITEVTATENYQEPETTSKEIEATETKEEADAEAVMKASHEQKQVWVISAVVDPRSGKEIGFDEATKKGILRMSEGIYYNPLTRRSKPIPQAMNERLIIMELKTSETSAEEKTSYGVLTVTTTRQRKQYTIKRVMDTETDEFVSIDEAKKRGILDLDTGKYYDKEEKAEIPLSEAIDLGLLEVEYDDTDPGESQSVTRTYSVHGVVDQRKKQKVSFDEAIRLGLLDMDEDVYVNNVTKEKIGISEAIRRGLIKAKIRIDDNKELFEEEEKLFKSKVGKLKSRILASSVFY
ncbi:uncharacterized protein LOC141911032 isoform X2 [Tubulanus polymorphus]|uniref:uncharacterized protein LOC141911032 isoform X2 n=1 Tax=Tubulanus polymorphus TaxID=672921 RepID=UPI003DA4D3EB